MERLPVSKSKKNASSFKFYDIEGIGSNTLQMSQSRATINGHARRRDSSHNERFYEEHDYERRVKKRRARLLTAAEEAFTHVKRSHHDPGNYFVLILCHTYVNIMTIINILIFFILSWWVCHGSL